MLGINTNVPSLTAQKNLGASSQSINTSIARLSSGLRINSARDDAAGLAIATRMSSDIRGSEVAKRNTNDGISALQIADGALSTVTDNVQRMRELAVQAATGTLTTDDRANLNAEFTQLADQIESVTMNTKFNGVNLLTAAAAGSPLSVQTGSASADKTNVTLVNGEAVSTALNAMGFDLTTAANATSAITTLDTQLTALNTGRATLGAGINRLDAVVANLDTTVTNVSAARGRIMDADFAKETANLTRTQILQQAGTAMLAQANQLPNNVLSLLR
jgi:flagellin